MNFKDQSNIHNLPLEYQYEALEIFINSKLVDNKSVTHNDIIAIGKKLKKANRDSEIHHEADIDQETVEHFDEELQKIQEKFDAIHSIEIENITTKLVKEKEQELEATKSKYEELIDRVVEVHHQSETVKLNSQKRRFDQELKQKLEQQAERLELEKIEALEKQREQYFEIFCKQFENKIEESNNAVRLEEQRKFNIEKQQLIKELKEQQKTREDWIIKCLQEKMAVAEEILKSRYLKLYLEYENICKYNVTLERDYQELQCGFQKFIDSTDGYYCSEYLLKLRSHALKQCEKDLKLFQSTLTEPLFTPEDFERCSYDLDKDIKEMSNDL